MKTKRQQMILELIEKFSIDTQEELISRLASAGYSATQATISRDIRELKLVKAMTPSGTYKYIQSSRGESAKPRFSSAFADSITHVDFAGNIVVIKTYPGMAQPVASCIDALGDSDLLGCVGGDDTIIVVVRDAATAPLICDKIRQVLHTL